MWDIKEIDWHSVPDCDMITYGFPCQDISVAGKQQGITKETRSGLVFDVLEGIKIKKPKYAICENVKNLVGKKFRKDFDNILAELESYGYKNYWAVLNAKDFGIPQNRERVFVVSIRNDVEQDFSFPQPFDNGLRLKDLLESEVDEKYFISNEKCQKLLSELRNTINPQVLRPERTPYGKAIRKQYEAGEIQESRHNMTSLQPRNDDISNTITTVQKDNLLLVPEESEEVVTGTYRRIEGFHENDISATIDAHYGKGFSNHQSRTAVCIPVLTPDRLEKRQNGRRFKTDGEPSFTVTAVDRHGVMVNEIQQIGLLDIKGNEQIRRVYSPDGISPTLNTCQGGNLQPKVLLNYRIRKLTPLECLRLMGFDDADYEILKESKISNSQIYKCAGNSIVVDVLEAIFKQLLCPTIEPTSESR